jgi:asparagine synthase (glutamine-hydrolysing)
VALSGESADEVFGGYPWFFRPEAVNAATFPWLALLRSSGMHDNFFSADLMATADPYKYVDRRYQQALEDVPRLAGEAADDARRRELFYFNITYFLPMLLHRKDRMSMASGFEVRVPFCDYRLVEYVWNIPWSQKSVGGIEKGVLRRACEDLLPHDVLYRKKSPYPTAAHPRYQEGVRQRALEILNDPNARIRPFVDVDQLKKLPAGGSLNSPFERLIQTEGWLRAYQIEVIA